MQAPFDNIVQHLFHQPSLLSVTVNELERMAEQHPYFAAAHFLLLKKMQDTQHPQFNSQLHKTTLYFNNPLWLQFLLQPEKVHHLPVLDKAPFLSNEQANATHRTQKSEAEHNDTIPPAVDEPANNTDEITAHEPVNAEAGMPQVNTGMMDVITEVFHEPQETFHAHESSEEVTHHPQQDINEPAAQTLEASAPVEETTEVPAANTSAEDTLVIAETVQHPLLIESTANNSNEIFAGEVNEEISAATNNAAAAFTPNETFREQQTDHLPSDFAKFANDVEITAPDNALPATSPDLPEIVAENNANNGTEHAIEIEQADETAFVGTGQPTGAQTEKPLLKIIETPAAHDDMLFEPYHTVDYFASQGIKLSKAENEAKDKLGHKLRSFTDWLKTMKKLPKASIENILSKNEESKVVEDAIHSIENKEVITEAMAEVFEKQGLTDKAAEVYQKLSLLNPAKSAYFATKIEDLKH